MVVFFTVEFKRPQKTDPVIDPVKSGTDPINDPVNLEDSIFKLIRDNEGIAAPEIARLVGKSLKTIKRNIAKLRESGKIEFRGAPKTSGYYLK